MLWLVGGTGPRHPPHAGERPWEQEVGSDGTSRALGLVLGRSTLRDAIARFGKGVDVALFESPGRPLSLEAYFSEATPGGIRGRLVLTLDPSPPVLEGLRARSSGARVLQSGTLRREVDARDAEVLAALPIAFVTFVPTANLDEATVRSRFGEPVERLPAGDGAVRWLYPDRGLAVTLSEQGKELIEYVDPAESERLRRLSSPAERGE
jgi:hypothetical protein